VGRRRVRYERTSTVTFKSPQDAQFSILRPGTVKYGRFRLGDGELPVRMRQPKEGAAVEALELDPELPGFTTYVVPIFPDKDATRDAFKTARKLKFEWPVWGLVNRRTSTWSASCAPRTSACSAGAEHVTG
jgi:hypothetical protein